MRRGKHFTVLELIVVAVIIAVLVSLLLPALANAKDHGKAADCMNNLRQVYVAFDLHADDSDGYFPHSYYWWRILGSGGYLGPGEQHGGHTTTWFSEKRWPSFRCAAEEGWVFGTADPNCRQPNPVTTGYDSDLSHCSFAYNWSINKYCGYYANYCAGVTKPRRFSRDTDNPGGSSAAPLVMDDSTPLWGWTMPFFQVNIDNLDAYYLHPYEGANFYAFRHPGRRANTMYMDGHGQAVKHKRETGVSLYVDIFEGQPHD